MFDSPFWYSDLAVDCRIQGFFEFSAIEICVISFNIIIMKVLANHL